MRIMLFSTFLAVFGCGGSGDAAESSSSNEAAGEPGEREAPHTDEADHEAHAEAAEHTQPAGDGPTTYGESLTDRELVELATIAADPTAYAGRVVKTEGEIATVCQQMGCWMEMRAEGVEPIRVPMAGHSFFLPKDVAGRHAIVEGEVSIRELSDDEREHLESEGALATAQALQISATGVVID